jgi:hypothetical protein
VQSKSAVELRNTLVTDEQRATTEAVASASLSERLGIDDDLPFNALHANKVQFYGGGAPGGLRTSSLANGPMEGRSAAPRCWAGS